MISINPFFKLRQGALHSLSLTFGQNLSVKSFCKCLSHLPWDVCPHQIYVTRQELIEHSCLFSYCFVFSMDLRKTMSSISLLCASCKLSQLREAFKKKTLKVRFLPNPGGAPYFWFFVRNFVGLTDWSTPFKTCFVFSGVSSDPSLLV